MGMSENTSEYKHGSGWAKRWVEIIPANGLPPAEQWRGLKLAQTIGDKGYTVDTFFEDTRKMIGFETFCAGSEPNKNLSGPLEESTPSTRTLSMRRTRGMAAK
jgi:hypothetical protein